MAVDEELDRWLERNGLSVLAPLLREHAIDSVGLLGDLSESDYREIGIAVGMRIRIRRALDTAAPATPAAPETRAAGAERRQLTVMFCDVVESTPLARRLDPEDLAALYHQYTERCIDATERYEGHVERFLGDGVLGYFGFPQAHEDDAVRAVLAGLQIVRSIDDLARESSVEIAVRVGITTGVVVVGDLYRNVNGRVNEVVGDTTNLAARVQGAAVPGAVVITESTKRLAGDTFEYEDIGQHGLKGIDAPVRLFRVLRERPSAVRFQSRSPARDVALIGREVEMAALSERWLEALEGRGRVVEIVGEAGYGKSRLAHEFAVSSCPDEHLVVQCSAFHRDSPLYPIVDALRGEVGGDPGDSREVLRARLEQFVGSSMSSAAPEELVEVLAVLIEGDHSPTSDLTPRQRRALSMDALCSYLVDRKRPLMVLVEDAHWADPSTLELLRTAMLQLTDRRVMLAITYRPEFEPPWKDDPTILTIEVGPLAASDSESIVLAMCGPSGLSPDLSKMIVSRAAGVPLFVEELTRTVLDAVGSGTEVTGVDAAGIDVPSTLADSLLARIDRLGPAKPVSQLAAAIGQEFDEGLLARVADLPEDDLVHQLAALVDAGIVAPSEARGTYFFRHALIRDVAYQTMLRARRRTVHGRIADELPVIRPDQDRAHPELRAQHLTRAARLDEAIDAWISAGERAAERSATVEAISHFEHGLDITANLESSDERDRRELQLQVRRAGMLRVSRGFGAADTGQAYQRARDLCVSLGDEKHLIPVLNGLYSFNLQHDYRQAGVVAGELLAVAATHGSDTDLMIGHKAVGVVGFHIGDPESAVSHLRQALQIYDRDRHAGDAYVYGTDHAETAASFLAMSLWVRAESHDALTTARWSVSHSESLNHLPSVAQALIYLSFLGVLERRTDVVDEAVPRLLAISEQIAFPLLAAAGRFWDATSKAFAGEAADEIDEMVASLDAWIATNSHSYLPFAYACLAEAHGLVGDADTGLVRIVEGLALAERSSEVWCTPELLRVRAGLLAQSGAPDEQIDADLDASLALARSQRARAWEIRTAASIAARATVSLRHTDASSSTPS